MVLTVDVVDFEQKFNFVLWRLTGKLMNGIDELLQRNRTGIVFVEYLEHTVREKWLQIVSEICFLIAEVVEWDQTYVFRCDDFFEVLTTNLLLAAHRFAEQLLQTFQWTFVESSSGSTEMAKQIKLNKLQSNFACTACRNMFVRLSQTVCVYICLFHSCMHEYFSTILRKRCLRFPSDGT